MEQPPLFGFHDDPDAWLDYTLSDATKRAKTPKQRKRTPRAPDHNEIAAQALMNGLFEALQRHGEQYHDLPVEDVINGVTNFFAAFMAHIVGHYPQTQQHLAGTMQEIETQIRERAQDHEDE